MLTHQRVLQFIKHNPALTIGTLEKEAGLSKNTLTQAVAGSRTLNATHLLKLTPILNKYGYNEGLYNKARVTAVVNHKGGVGKTTTTACLGAALARQNFRVLLIDLDPQSNLSQILGIEEPETSVADTILSNDPLPVLRIVDNLHLVPSSLELADKEMDLNNAPAGDLRLRRKLSPLLSEYDYVLIDCPPSLGKLTLSALFAANGVLIPLQPEISAVKGLNTLLNRYHMIRNTENETLTIDGIVFTMVKKNTVHDAMKNVIHTTMGMLHIYNTEIRELIDYQKSQITQQSIFDFSPHSPAAKNYEDFCNEYIAYLQIVK